MSIITRGADLVYTFRFLRLLTTPFEKTKAFELGIIDEKGKRDKKKVPYIDSKEKKDAYTPFHRIVFNIKKLLEKVPGGKSKLASYAAALFLIKEKFGVSDKNLDKILKESNIDIKDMLEEQNSWFIMKDGSITPGTYRISSEKVINSTCDELCYEGDRIRIDEHLSTPVGHVFNIPIFKALHITTNQEIYIAPGELVR